MTNTHDDSSAADNSATAGSAMTGLSFTEEQIHELADAVASVTGELNLEAVRQRLESEARRLAHATDSTLSPVGTKETPGPLPPDVTASVLRIPVPAGQAPFGVLSLTKEEGRFTHADAQLLLVLVAAAGSAIENAGRFTDEQCRVTWLEACADLVRDLLQPTEEGGLDSLHFVAQRALDVSGAALASIGLPTEEPGRIFSVAAAGLGWPAIVGRSVLVGPEVRSRLRASSEPIALPTLVEAFVADLPADTERRSAFGRTLVTPLGSPGEDRGMLILSWPAGAGAFSPVELEMIAVFASYVALALEQVGIYRTREERAVHGDRERIARDLHDLVIQRIFAAGLSIQGLRRFTQDPVAIDRISQVTAELDATIREVRDTIYSLRGVMSRPESLRSRILAAVRAGTGQLPSTPNVELSGPVDFGLDENLGDNIIAVISEGLSNVARHSGATTVEVSVRVDPEEVRLVIADNGVGITGPGRGIGLDNLRARARLFGGQFSITSSPGHGTRLLWSAPLTAPAASGPAA